MSCPNCGGETGPNPVRDDPRTPAMGGHDPGPTVVFCSAECVETYDGDPVPATWGIAISSPEGQ